jgi:pimeloyl-ACP methyl ester carboxylesterase
MIREGTVQRGDGRVLAYADAGDVDGAPVLWFHGIPGSRLDLVHTYGEDLLDGAGIRLIGIDRPGFGKSGFQRRRRFRDWPDDISAVMEKLGIERFGVVGYSCGGPYVAECVRAMPDRLAGAGIVSGVGPSEMPRFRKGLNQVDSVMTRLARIAPPLARLAIKQATRTAERNPDKFDQDFEKELSGPDRELFSDAAIRTRIRELFLESTRQGPTGVAHDYAIWGKRWGFPFEQVELPVRLWHGDDDAIVPLHHAEHVSERLPNGDLRVLKDEGHLHSSQVWREILTTVARGESAVRSSRRPN